MALLILLVLGAALFGEKVVNTAGDLVERGRRLSHSPAVDSSKQVPAAPADLHAQAEQVLGRSIDPDAYTLARMLRSEGGSGSPAEKQARAWVALNDRAAHGWSMLYTIAGPDRLYGRQIGWRYASSDDPYENDLAVAEAVLTGQLPDNTGGAVKFVDIESFGAQEGTGSYEATRAQWATEGLSPRKVDGTASDFRVFVRDGGGTTDEA